MQLFSSYSAIKKNSKPVYRYLLMGISITALTLLIPFYAQATGAKDAADWLLKKQNIGGSWGSNKSPTSVTSSTSSVLEALQSVGKLSALQGQRGATYLQKQNPAASEELSRKILGLVAAGKTPSASDLQRLLTFQNKDGGFAPILASTSTVLDTAFAVLALGLGQGKKISTTQKALGYLITKQRRDGGWGFFDSANDSSPYLTGYVLQTFAQYKHLYNLSRPISKGTTYLLRVQKVDGSWGSGNDAVISTAVAALGLVEADPKRRTALGKIIAWLIKKQASDGSFSSDAFTTSYALRVLDSQKADLSIVSKDLKVSPSKVLLNGKVTITATFRNLGSRNAPTFTVALYRGNPSSGGVRLDQKTISSLAYGKSSKQTLVWNKATPIGTSYLYIFVDNGAKVPELSERNNIAIVGLPILAPIDLATTSKSIVLKPVFPSPGKPLEIGTVVSNTGGIEAKNIEVGFYNGNPASGGKLFDTLKVIPKLLAGQSAIVRAKTSNLKQGNYTVYVVVDPNKKLNDSVRSNNVGSKAFQVRPRVDLVVNSQGLFFSKDNVFEGEKVQIRVGVYNAEAATAKDAIVRLYDGDPKTSGKQIGSDLKITVPGYKAVYTTFVTFDTKGKPGTRFIRVLVDPDKKLPDIHPSNNEAVRILRVIGLPDLNISAKEIYFSPSTIYESARLRIHFRLRNIGLSDANTASQIHIYDKDPSTPGTKSIGALNFQRVKKGAYANLYFYWNTARKVGAHKFWVVIDKDGKVRERNRTNNTTAFTFKVLPPRYPDASLVSGDLSYSPSKPIAGDMVTITAKIHNPLSKNMANVVVRFHKNSASSTNKLGDVIIPSLPAYSSRTVNFRWRSPVGISSQVIAVMVDPDRKIRETSENNNTASIKIPLSLSAASGPSNFKVTANGVSTLRFTWKAGSAASSAGISGYRLYCNQGLLNPDAKITASATVKASSSYSTRYPAKYAFDKKTNTQWYPRRGNGPHSIEFKFSRAYTMSGLLIYWASSGARNYDLLIWSGGKWKKLTTRNASGSLHKHSYKPFTTDQVKIYFHSSNRSYSYMGIRDIHFFESKLITGTSYTQNNTSPGAYQCYVVGETTPVLRTPRSNTDSANLGDTKAPSSPSNTKVSYSNYTATVSWSAPFDSDLAGFRIYSNQGLNVARFGKGASAHAKGGTSYYPSRIIDSSTTSRTYVRVPALYTIKLAKTYNIYSIKVYGYRTNNCKYKLYASTNGTSFTEISDQSSGHTGLKEIKLSTVKAIRYLRIVPVGTTGAYFYLSSVQLLTKDFAPLTNHGVYLSPRTLGNHYAYSYWGGYRWDWDSRSTALRRFSFRNVGISNSEVIKLWDIDFKRTLERLSGSFAQTWKSNWIKARRYRVEYHPTTARNQYGFVLTSILTYGFQKSTTYKQANLYRNGTFQYAVAAVDTSGNESKLSKSVSITIKDNTAPAPPTRLKVTGGNAKASLTWTAKYYRSERDRVGFRIYRDGKLIGTTSTTNYRFTNTKLINGKTYKYEVSAYDLNGNESAKAGPVSVVPSAIDLTIKQTGIFADLFVMPRNPSIYDSAVIAIIARNIGQQSAPVGIEIGLYDGLPKASTKIGIITLVPSLQAGGKAIGTYTWILKNVKPGKHRICAVIDPNNKIAELNEKNNQACRDVTIHADPFLSTNVTSINSSKFPQVEVCMRVRDGSGGGLFGLDERNFKLKEDGKDQSPLKVRQLNQNQQGLPKVDVVYIIDTSCSMYDEWRTVCQVTTDIRDLLLASRVDVKATVYGLGTTLGCGTKLRTVIWRGKPKSAHSEDWGPGTVYAAIKHSFRKGAARVLIPISDEGAYAGNSWTKEDTESVNEAIKAANSTQPKARVFPFWGKEVQTSNVIAKEMQRLAKATGGKAFPFLNATQVVQEIVNAALNSIADYCITYTSSNTARDGKKRKVDVDTKYNVSKGKASGTYIPPLDNLPDLLFTSKIQIAPKTPVPGQMTTITVTIRNVGGQPAKNVVVMHSLGDPKQGGYPLSRQTIPLMGPGTSKTLTLSWQALPGISRIVVTIDPDSKIQESNEKNNQIDTFLALPGTRGIELAVSSFDLSLSPSQAMRGDEVTLRALVHNIGTRDAKTIGVAFFKGNPLKGGIGIGAITIPLIAKGKAVATQIKYILKKAGDFDLYVVVDPYNQIKEDLQANNKAHRIFPVGQKSIDLAVLTDKKSYPANNKVNIKVTLQNNMPNPFKGKAEICIEDKAGNLVTKLKTLSLKDLPVTGMKQWPYRVPVRWKAPAGGTKHLFLGVSIDFGTALKQVGASSKVFDPKSIRVMLMNQAKVDRLIPFRFKKAAGSTNQTKGKLLVFLKDPIAAGKSVLFYIFFDAVRSIPKPKGMSYDPPPFPKTGWALGYVEDYGKYFIRERLPNGNWDKEVYIYDRSRYNDDTRAIALGDFNNDGVTDLITASGRYKDVSFHPGKRSLTTRFDSAKRKVVGSISSSYSAMSMAVGDFNNDGNLDFVISRYYYIYTFTGKGNGTFTAKSYYRKGFTGQVRGKVLQDLDGDGNLDLIFSTYRPANIHWMKGDGKGSFANAKQLITGDSNDPYGISYGDFDSDGKSDLLVNWGSNGDSYFYKGLGGGKFKPKVTISSLDNNNHAAWATGDWNYDGKIDLFSATYTSKWIYFYHGKGDASFYKPIALNKARHNFLGIALAPPNAQLYTTAGNAEKLPSRSWNLTWNTGTTPSGDYQVRVKLFESSGLLNDAKAAFSIIPDIKAQAVITTDRLAYPGNANVALTSRIFNKSVNHAYSSLVSTIQIDDDKGKKIDTLSFTMQQLRVGHFRDRVMNWNTKTYKPGKYKATLNVFYNSKQVAKAEATFLILTSAQSGVGMIGNIKVSPGIAKPGETVEFEYDVTNIGNQALKNQSVYVRIFADKDNKEKGNISKTINLDIKKTWQQKSQYNTKKLAAGKYTILLTTKLGTKDITLDTTELELKAKFVRPKLTVKIKSPQNGTKVKSPVISVTGDVSDGDAKVSVNGQSATVTGPSLQAASFTQSQINIKSCQATISAKATRKNGSKTDTASDSIKVTFDFNPIVLKSGKTFYDKTKTPGGLAIGKSGTLLFTNPKTGVIVRLTYDAQKKITKEKQIASKLTDPRAVLEDSKGNLFVAQTSKDNVIKISGGKTTVLLQQKDGLLKPSSLAFDGKGGVFVASQGNGKIFLIDNKGKFVEYASGFQKPTALAYDSVWKKLYVADLQNGNLYYLTHKGSKATQAAGTINGNLSGVTFIDQRILLSDATSNALYFADTYKNKLQIIAGGLKGIHSIIGTTKNEFFFATDGFGIIFGQVEKLKCVTEDKPPKEFGPEPEPEPEEEFVEEFVREEFIKEEQTQEEKSTEMDGGEQTEEATRETKEASENSFDVRSETSQGETTPEKEGEALTEGTKEDKQETGVTKDKDENDITPAVGGGCGCATQEHSAPITLFFFGFLCLFPLALRTRRKTRKHSK